MRGQLRHEHREVLSSEKIELPCPVLQIDTEHWPAKWCHIAVHFPCWLTLLPCYSVWSQVSPTSDMALSTITALPRHLKTTRLARLVGIPAVR